MKISIEKTSNIGNTFTGLVCSAFNCGTSDVRIDALMQFSDMGTIEVRGNAYDWFDRGESVDFIEAA